jgi:hypothetical protein
MPNTYRDNTQIESFRNCSRKFFFRHMLHWDPREPALSLIMGSSWHSAMDVIWKELNEDKDQEIKDVLVKGMAAFMANWQEEGLPSYNDFLNLDPITVEKFVPRTPMIASEMLWNYIVQRRDFIGECEILAIEQPFAVPLDPSNPDLWYVGRLDKVVRYRGKLLVIEHKTTTLYKKDGYFRSLWIESFSPNSQVDGYLHAARMLYGPSAKRLWIDAALVHKTVHEGFMFIPVERQPELLEGWLWETHYWIDAIKQNIDLYEGTPVEKTLSAFPRNTSYCDAYNKACEYRDVCQMISNPATYPMPDNLYREEKWEPFDVLNLDTLGLKKD